MNSIKRLVPGSAIASEIRSADEPGDAETRRDDEVTPAADRGATRAISDAWIATKARVFLIAEPGLNGLVRLTGTVAEVARPILGAVLLGLSTFSLVACDDGGRLEEAVEEVQDEAKDAMDEIEDEVDDLT